MNFGAQTPGTYAFCLDNRAAHFFPQYLQVEYIPFLYYDELYHLFPNRLTFITVI